MALGASRNQVLRLVIADGMRLAGVGVAIGLGAAVALPTDDRFAFRRQCKQSGNPGGAWH